MRKAAVDRALQAAGRGRIEELRRLLEEGLEVDSTNENDYTPLMAASANYRVEIGELLLRAGADQNRVTVHGSCVLRVAVGSTPSLPEDQAECVRLLLAAGADPNRADDRGGTPLMRAAWFGCQGAVAALLGAGARREAAKADGSTAADLARRRRHLEIVALLEGGE